MLLNLLATDHIEDILRAFDFSFGVVEEVASEALYLKNLADGTKELIDIGPLIGSGALFVTSPETENEVSSYVHYAAYLDDGEAMSLAIAHERRWLLATDDRKTRNLIKRERLDVGPITTVELLQGWQSTQGIDRETMRETLWRIWRRASYHPKPATDEGRWWFALAAD